MSGNETFADHLGIGHKYKKKKNKENKKVKKPKEGMLKYFKDLFKEN